MVLGSVLTASPPYTVNSARSELLGYTPTATYCLTRSKSFVQNPCSATGSAITAPSVGKSYDSALPSISPLKRSLTTLPWRPSVYYGHGKMAPPSGLTRSAPSPLSKSSELIRIDDFKVLLLTTFSPLQVRIPFYKYFLLFLSFPFFHSSFSFRFLYLLIQGCTTTFLS